MQPQPLDRFIDRLLASQRQAYRLKTLRIFLQEHRSIRGIDHHAQCVSCAPLGGPEYLYEIEVTAYKGAAKDEQE
jgi:hypothetical protein